MLKIRTSSSEAEEENEDVAEDEDEMKKRRLEDETTLISAKRRLETIQEKVELATSTKSKADETEKRFKRVAKIAKRRYGYVRSARAYISLTLND